MEKVEELRDSELFCDRVSGFLYELLNYGYNYNEAWNLLLASKEGMGILNRDYTYFIHFQGRASADKVLQNLGKNLEDSKNIKIDVIQLKLLTNLIYMANKEYGIPFSDMFNKTELEKFIKKCGVVLGNYDDKLIKTYLL